MPMINDMAGFVLIFLLGWLGVGSSLLYIYNLLRFQMPFSAKMVEATIYDKATHKSILTTAWVGTASILVVSVCGVYFLHGTSIIMTLVMTGLGGFVALLRGRHFLGWNINNIRRFVRSHIICMDRDKTQQYLQDNYNIALNTWVKTI